MESVPDPFPRPFKTLLVTGWTIDHGAVAKEGVVAISDSDEPEGRILIADCTFTNNLYPASIKDEDQLIITLICIVVMSRKDVQEAIEAWT